MTQNFREEFKNARLEAASKFLGGIADNFKEKITNAEIYRPTSDYAYASFKDASLQKVSRMELLGLEGFLKLKRVCADPALGPQTYEFDCHYAELESLQIHVAKPYAASGFLQVEKEWQQMKEAQHKRNRPGFLRRAFARIKERRTAPVVNRSYIVVSSNKPKLVTEPLTSPPPLS